MTTYRDAVNDLHSWTVGTEQAPPVFGSVGFVSYQLAALTMAVKNIMIEGGLCSEEAFDKNMIHAMWVVARQCKVDQTFHAIVDDELEEENVEVTYVMTVESFVSDEAWLDEEMPDPE